MKIKENLLRIREQIAQTCFRCGRNEKNVKLLAVSKFHSLTEIFEAAEVGQIDFGENYFQEWQKKSADFAQKFPELPLQWHMIGHLQSRKGHLAAGKFPLIHTLDSEKLAQSLQKTLMPHKDVQNVLIEVNIAEEKQKTGILRQDLPLFVDKILCSYPELHVKGLMCMPPYSEEKEDSRKYFSALRALRNQLEISFGIKLPELSMGMSGDFTVAIEEGATIIRIGTAIFGPRPIKFPAN